MSSGALIEFPWTFGDDSGEADEVEHAALLESMRDVLDPTEDTLHEIETWAQSLALAVIWDASERLANQALPTKMLEALPMWEQVLKFTPSPDDTDNERRDRVAAKLRGLVNNAIPDIEETARKVLSGAFVEVIIADPDETIEYWQGGTLGPPGFEWYSSRAIVGVRMSKAGLSDAQFDAKRSALISALDALIPAWMGYATGTGTAFVVGSGIVGVDLI